MAACSSPTDTAIRAWPSSIRMATSSSPGASAARQPGDFNTPHSLVVDNNDVIYVADRGNSRIQVFDTEGNLKAVWKLPTAPWALCLTNGPNQVMFVGSVGRVYKMDLSGKILGVFGRPGRMPGTIDSVHGIACPDEKAVYLANLYASRIDKWVVQ